MTKRQFTILAFRLFAIYSAIVLIQGLPEMIQRWGHSAIAVQGTGMNIFDFLLGLAVPVWVIYVLWARDGWLMRKVFEAPELADADETSASTKLASSTESYYDEPASPDSIQRTIISLIGIWLFATSAPIALYELLYIVIQQGATTPAPNTSHEITVLLTLSLPKVLLGLWLMFRPWRLQLYLAKFQSKSAETADKNA